MSTDSVHELKQSPEVNDEYASSSSFVNLSPSHPIHNINPEIVGEEIAPLVVETPTFRTRFLATDEAVFPGLLSTPRERRLQTFAVIVWVALLPTCVGAFLLAWYVVL